MFQAAVNWIKHCRHLRVKRAGEIMRCVRFADITPDDMLKYVEPNINLIDCPDVRNMLLNFYRYAKMCFICVIYAKCAIKKKKMEIRKITEIMIFLIWVDSVKSQRKM